MECWKLSRSSVLCTSFIRMLSHGEIFRSRQRAIQILYGSSPASCSRLAFCGHRSWGSFPLTGSQMASRDLLRKLARMAVLHRNRWVTDDPAYWSTHACSPFRVMSSGLRELKKWLLSSLITSMLWSRTLRGSLAIPIRQSTTPKTTMTVNRQNGRLGGNLVVLMNCCS